MPLSWRYDLYAYLEKLDKSPGQNQPLIRPRKRTPAAAYTLSPQARSEPKPYVLNILNKIDGEGVTTSSPHP
jgi:hypothetical protein